ncbi:MAG TPA: chromate transporter [Candidatus Cloacimonadota bacterium]|nr:chromate transporter [Candidatus Cloacimonadota bacterium]
MMLWDLFITFFRIGLFSFGGGYAMLSLIQQEVVINHHWLSQQQMTDMIAISQMTPGPIAINAATFVGYRQAGFWGSVFTTLGVILPSLIIMLLLTLFYLKLRNQEWFKTILQELRPLIIGLIAAAALLTAKSSFPDLFSVFVFLGCFLLAWKTKLNPILLMVLAGAAGVIYG